MDPVLQDSLLTYAKARGALTLEEVIRKVGADRRYLHMAQVQDQIGWRRTMEGMISREVVVCQETYRCHQEKGLDTGQWARTLVIKLLEVVHGQWLYRNLTVHDAHTGLLQTRRKEELQREIDKQMEEGGTGLLADDQYLAEINLVDLETSSGEQHEYWLLAIKAAKKATMLTQTEPRAEDLEPG